MQMLLLGDVLREGTPISVNPLLIWAWAGLLINAINSIPAGELDGGRISFAIWGRKVCHFRLMQTADVMCSCVFSYEFTNDLTVVRDDNPIVCHLAMKEKMKYSKGVFYLIQFFIWQASSRFTGASIVLLALSSLVNDVAFYWAVLLFFLQRGPIAPLSEEITDPDNKYVALGVVVLVLGLLVCLPYPFPFTSEAITSF
ncbi:unnamed protein product [Ilex paraguariensis]|uniref:Uncharacterized protein n=1 Tax=Ilex paraguariensis TaxID=185542 RepID=A0ABC8TXF7_9AQUA